MKKTKTDYVEEAWASARQFADPGHERDYVIGYLRGIIKTMEEANEHADLQNVCGDNEVQQKRLHRPRH